MARKSSQSAGKTVPGSVFNMVLYSTATGLHLLVPAWTRQHSACLFVRFLSRHILQYYPVLYQEQIPQGKRKNLQ